MNKRESILLIMVFALLMFGFCQGCVMYSAQWQDKAGNERAFAFGRGEHHVEEEKIDGTKTKKKVSVGYQLPELTIKK